MFGRLIEYTRQVISALYHFMIAGDSGKQGGLIDGSTFTGTFLQAAFTEGVGRHFTGNGNDWQLIHVGIGNTRDQVGGPWPGRGNAGADIACGTCQAAGHKSSALFMFGQHTLYIGIV